MGGNMAIKSVPTAGPVYLALCGRDGAVRMSGARGGDMTKLALTLVSLLSMVCMPVHADENKNCGLKQHAALDVARTPGRVLVPVTIQGHSAWMVLNTASAFSLIFDDEPRALQLHRKRFTYGMLWRTNAELGEVAVADELQIGDVRYRSVSFPIFPRRDTPASFDQRPIIGGLGMDVLSQLDFELDISHGKLNLFSQDHCPGRVVYWSGPVARLPVRRSNLGELYFPIELDGKTLEAVMSPGGQYSVLRTDVAREVYGIDEHSAGNETRVEASGRIRTYRLMNLTTPAFEVRNELVELLPQEYKHCIVAEHRSNGSMIGYDGCKGAHPLLLGIDVLSKLRIYFATKEQMLYLSPANTAATDLRQTADRP